MKDDYDDKYLISDICQNFKFKIESIRIIEKTIGIDI